MMIGRTRTKDGELQAPHSALLLAHVMPGDYFTFDPGYYHRSRIDEPSRQDYQDRMMRIREQFQRVPGIVVVDVKETVAYGSYRADIVYAVMPGSEPIPGSMTVCIP